MKNSFIVAMVGMVLMAPVFASAAPAAPECVEFDASDTKVEKGDRVDLSWETTGGTFLRIEPNTYETGLESAVAKGDVTVRPQKTTEYTLTVSRGSSEDECSVTVRVEGDSTAASTKTDTDTKTTKEVKTVTAHETRDQSATTVVSFTELPYTGVDMSGFLSTLFFVLLGLWIASVSFVMAKGRMQFTASTNHTGLGSAIPHAEYRAKSSYLTK